MTRVIIRTWNSNWAWNFLLCWGGTSSFPDSNPTYNSSFQSPSLFAVKDDVLVLRLYISFLVNIID